MSEVREELGTCKSAVEAFANLMAVAIDVPEVQLHYWLDCYYQLRRAYEAERMGAAPEAERAVPAEEKAPEPEKPAALHLCNITTDAHFGTLVSCGEVVSIKKHRVIRIVYNPVAWCHRHFRRFYDKKRKSEIHGVFG